MPGISVGVIKDANVNWAKVRERDKFSGKYQVEIHNLTAAQKKQIQDMYAGRPAWTVIKKDDKYPEKGEFVVIKTNKPPRIVDSLNREVPEDLLIGNGSICNVEVLVLDPVSPQGVRKVQLNLKTVQIIKLVEYKQDLPAVKGGFTVDSENKSVDNPTLKEVD